MRVYFSFIETQPAPGQDDDPASPRTHPFLSRGPTNLSTKFSPSDPRWQLQLQPLCPHSGRKEGGKRRKITDPSFQNATSATSHGTELSFVVVCHPKGDGHRRLFILLLFIPLRLLKKGRTHMEGQLSLRPIQSRGSKAPSGSGRHKQMEIIG